MDAQQFNELTEIQQVSTSDSIMLLTDEIDNVVERATVDNLLYNSISTDNNNALKQGVDNKLYVGSAINLYDSEYNYSQGQWVLDNGVIYKSLVDDNLGNPTSDTDYWEEVSFGGGGTWGSIIGTLSNQTDLNTALNGKVNTSDLVEVNPMITSYVSGTSGYNIWANGYCEQWGFRSRAAATETITLTKTYADTNYNIIAQLRHTADSTDGRPLLVRGITANSFVLNSYTSYEGFYWKTCGYLAEGEY